MAKFYVDVDDDSDDDDIVMEEQHQQQSYHDDTTTTTGMDTYTDHNNRLVQHHQLTEDDDDLSEGEIREYPREEPDMLSSYYSEQENYSLTQYQEPDATHSLHNHHHHPLHVAPNTSAPIHYHIYYTPDPTPPPENSSTWSWSSGAVGWSLFGVAVLAHVLYWYSPAAPPDHDALVVQNMTWKDYWLDQSRVAWSLVSSWSSTAAYIVGGCWHGLQADWQLRMANRSWGTSFPGWLASSYFFASQPPPLDHKRSCRWDFDSARWVDVNSPLPLFGQDLVQARLGEVLRQRRNQQTQSATPIPTATQPPLLLLAMGGPSTGKQHLGWLLADRFLICNEDIQNPRHAVLSLDLAAHMHNNNNNDMSIPVLWSQIQQHARDYPNGNLILLSHVPFGTTTTTNLAIQLVHLLQQEQEQQQQDDDKDPLSPALFQNTIFLWTTSFGSDTIHKLLRHYSHDSQHDLPPRELESYLRYQLLDVIQQVNTDNDNNDNNHASTTQEWLESMILLPFLPWTRDAVAERLVTGMQQQWGISLQDSTTTPSSTTPSSTTQFSTTLSYLLKETTLEWTTWVHKATQAELWSFVEGGGQAVDGLLERLEPPAYCGTSSILPVLPVPAQELVHVAQERHYRYRLQPSSSKKQAAMGIVELYECQSDGTCGKVCDYSLS